MPSTTSWSCNASFLGIVLLLIGISTFPALLESEEEEKDSGKGASGRATPASSTGGDRLQNQVGYAVQSIQQSLKNGLLQEEAEVRVRGRNLDNGRTPLCGSKKFEDDIKEFKANNAKTQKMNEQLGSAIHENSKPLLAKGRHYETLLKTEISKLTTLEQELTTQVKTFREEIVELRSQVQTRQRDKSDLSLMNDFWLSPSADELLIPEDISKDEDGYVGCECMEEKETELLKDSLMKFLKDLKEPDSSRNIAIGWHFLSCFISALKKLDEHNLKIPDNYEHLLRDGGNSLAEEEAEELMTAVDENEDVDDLEVNVCKGFCSDFAGEINEAEEKIYQVSMLYTKIQEKREHETRLAETTLIIENTQAELSLCSVALQEVELMVSKIDTLAMKRQKASQSKQLHQKKLRKLKQKQNQVEAEVTAAINKERITKKKCTEASELVKNTSCEVTKIKRSIQEQQSHFTTVKNKEQVTQYELSRIKQASDAYLLMKTHLQQLLMYWTGLLVNVKTAVDQMVPGEHHNAYVSHCRLAEESFQGLGLPRVYHDMSFIDTTTEIDAANSLFTHIKGIFDCDVFTAVSTAGTFVSGGTEERSFQTWVTTFMSYCGEKSSEKGFCWEYLRRWYDKSECSHQDPCKYPCKGSPCKEVDAKVGSYLLDESFERLVNEKELEINTLTTELEEISNEMTITKRKLIQLETDLQKHQGDHGVCEDELLKVVQHLKQNEEILKKIVDEDAVFLKSKIQKKTSKISQNVREAGAANTNIDQVFSDAAKQNPSRARGKKSETSTIKTTLKTSQRETTRRSEGE